MTDALTVPNLDEGRDDWTFAANFYRTFAAQVSPVTEHIADRIQAEFPGFASIERGEYAEIVHEHALNLLESLATRTIPDDLLASERARGGRAAKRGIPVESILRSYHIGYQEMWRALLARILAEEPTHAAHLPDMADFMWTQLWTVTGAMVEGHTEAVRARTEARVTLERQFLETLYGGRATAEPAVLLARAVDFHPEGTFRAICCPAALRATGWDPRTLDGLQRSLLSIAFSAQDTPDP